MMPLTLTLQLGSKILVEATKIEVVKIHSASDLVVKCGAGEFDICDDSWTKVAEGVELRAPYPRADRVTGARLQIEAPGMYVKRL